MKNYTLFEQIYIKCGRNKQHYKVMKMYFGEIVDKLEESSSLFKLFILYIECNMVKKPSVSWEETQTLVFDFNDERIKKWTTSNKNNFYKIIKELVDSHIVFKGNKPKQYIVNPFYISCCSEAQMEEFHKTKVSKFANSQQMESSPVPLEYLVKSHQVKTK